MFLLVVGEVPALAGIGGVIEFPVRADRGDKEIADLGHAEQGGLGGVVQRVDVARVGCQVIEIIAGNGGSQAMPVAPARAASLIDCMRQSCMAFILSSSW
jgi:hypothetical protein